MEGVVEFFLFFQCCGTVTIFYGSGPGSDFLKSYSSGSGSGSGSDFDKLRFRFRI